MESVCRITETKKFIRANSNVSFDRTKQAGKYDKIKIRPLGIRYQIPFKKVFDKLYEVLCQYIFKNHFCKNNLCSFLMFIMHTQT